MKNGKNAALTVAIDGILAAVALTLSFLESLIPDIAFMPVGAKLGLSNIAIMFAVLSVGFADGFVIVILKSGFVFFTRGPVSAFMSISGSVLSFVCLVIIVAVFKKLNKEFSYIAISVICAVMHNTGQTIAASIYMKTNLVVSYLPILIVVGIFTGTVTGIILKIVMPYLVKINIKNSKGLK